LGRTEREYKGKRISIYLPDPALLAGQKNALDRHEQQKVGTEMRTPETEFNNQEVAGSLPAGGSI
jgi:hypothetical protein